MAEQQEIAIPVAVARRSGMWRRILIVGAIVLGGSIAWHLMSGKSTAGAAVDLALKVAGEYRERQYQVTAEIRTSDNRKRGIVSQLYVRGPQEFVLDHPGILPGARLWIGSDSHEYWVLPILGPVWVTQDNGPVKAWLDQLQVTTPFLQMTSALERLQDRYELRNARPTNLPSTTEVADLRRFRHIHGTLRPGERQGAGQAKLILPTQVDLAIDPESGEVRRLVLDWSASPKLPHPGLQRITFELANFAQHPHNWYQHRGHHKGDRRILKMPPVRGE